MILLIDNYDSFVYNLARYLTELGCETVVVRNDAVTVADVAKLGFGHPMGPLALADLIGLDTCVAIMDVLREELGDAKYAPCALLIEHVNAGRLGRKSGRGFYTYE